MLHGQLRDYDASSGTLLNAWPLPDVPSGGGCGSPHPWACPTIRLELVDAARGLAAYILDLALLFLAVVVDRASIYSNWMYLGGWLAVNVAIAFLLAHIYVRERGLVPRLLAKAPSVWIGRRSYGIYLIHLPIFFVLSPARVPLSTWPLFAVRMTATCTLAAGMFKWIETPFLRRKRYPSPTQTHEPVEDPPPTVAPALPAHRAA